MNFPPDMTRAERALIIAAAVVMRHGDKYAGYLEFCEALVEKEKTQSGHRERASRILQSLTRGLDRASVR